MRSVYSAQYSDYKHEYIKLLENKLENHMKLKITDRDISCLYYLFLICAFCSLGSELYEKFFIAKRTMDLSSFYTFLFFALLTRYYYAIVYLLIKLEGINQQERQRQLDREKELENKEL